MAICVRAIPFKNGEGEGKKFCQFSRPPIQKMAFLRPPIQQNVIFETRYTKILHFRDPLIQQNGIFETPYTKNGIFETPYTTKWPF